MSSVPRARVNSLGTHRSRPAPGSSRFPRARAAPRPWRGTPRAARRPPSAIGANLCPTPVPHWNGQPPLALRLLRVQQQVLRVEPRADDAHARAVAGVGGLGTGFALGRGLHGERLEVDELAEARLRVARGVVAACGGEEDEVLDGVGFLRGFDEGAGDLRFVLCSLGGEGVSICASMEHGKYRGGQDAAKTHPGRHRRAN